MKPTAAAKTSLLVVFVQHDVGLTITFHAPTKTNKVIKDSKAKNQRMKEVKRKNIVLFIMMCGKAARTPCCREGHSPTEMRNIV